MFELQNVSVQLGSRQILDNVSARLEPGRLTVVVGPNGAGKSTLLKVMTGEIAPYSGKALFDGKDLSLLPPRDLARRRAVLPQSSQLAFPFTVLEVVRLGLQARAGLDARQRRRAPLDALEQVDLGGFGNRRYQELSGGEQQRVHLARVLCQIEAPVVDEKPQYLFLDEPTSSLDIRHQISTLEAAHRFSREGGAVLAILHDMNLAATFADHLIVMRNGQVASEGRPSTVISSELMRDVFEISLQVNVSPSPGMPFILPQSLRTSRS
ncbi:heme ABC transporter ATP-binding protein [Terrihabitans sp. B22-R8]|uniref:heme ABC transporter ATP-binding protein n=1 Tax=Terrihabitans sp. B22-R8 TaxID=3425128 RepID=UPI00403C5DDE